MNQTPTLARLFLWEGYTVYVGPVADTSEHRHHAAQISFGLEGAFRLDTGSGWAGPQYARIPANLRHRYDGGGARQLVILLDGETPEGAEITRQGVYLGDPPGGSRPAIPTDLLSARRFVDWACTGLAETVVAPGRDPRLQRVLAHIADPRGRRFKARDLAAIACLSEDRFLHLFSQTMRLPLRRYILWRRILISVAAAASGDDLTRAALAGGFSDSAHFSRVFRGNFGLTPSAMLKNSRFVQVVTAEDD